MNMNKSHLGMVFAHFFEIDRAAPNDGALWSSGTLFQTLAMLLDAMFGYPGTGGRISREFRARVNLKHGFSWNRH